MTKSTITTTVEVELTIEIAAQWFANLDDDSQARFFVAVAKEFEGWDGLGLGADYQLWRIGSHLRNCECSTDGARELIRGIAYGMENGTH